MFLRYLGPIFTHIFYLRFSEGVTLYPPPLISAKSHSHSGVSGFYTNIHGFLDNFVSPLINDSFEDIPGMRLLLVENSPILKSSFHELSP